MNNTYHAFRKRRRFKVNELVIVEKSIDGIENVIKGCYNSFDLGKKFAEYLIDSGDYEHFDIVLIKPEKQLEYKHDININSIKNGFKKVDPFKEYKEMYFFQPVIFKKSLSYHLRKLSSNK